MPESMYLDKQSIVIHIYIAQSLSTLNADTPQKLFILDYNFYLAGHETLHNNWQILWPSYKTFIMLLWSVIINVIKGAIPSPPPHTHIKAAVFLGSPNCSLLDHISLHFVLSRCCNNNLAFYQIIRIRCNKVTIVFWLKIFTNWHRFIPKRQLIVQLISSTSRGKKTTKPQHRSDLTINGWSRLLSTLASCFASAACSFDSPAGMRKS